MQQWDKTQSTSLMHWRQESCCTVRLSQLKRQKIWYWKTHFGCSYSLNKAGRKNQSGSSNAKPGRNKWCESSRFFPPAFREGSNKKSGMHMISNLLVKFTLESSRLLAQKGQSGAAHYSCAEHWWENTENEQLQWKFSSLESFETSFLNFLLVLAPTTVLDWYLPVHPDSYLPRYLVRKDFMSEKSFCY